MLGTNEVPIIIDTRDPNTFFDPNGPDVIAYGELALTNSVEEWTEFTFRSSTSQRIASPPTS